MEKFLGGINYQNFHMGFDKGQHNWLGQVYGQVAERKKQNRSQGTEGFIGFHILKGLDFIRKRPSWSLRNTDLTQNTDWTWNINRYQSFQSWGSLSPGSLLVENRRVHAQLLLLPALTLVYQGPLAQFTANCHHHCRPKEKKKGRPDSSAKQLTNFPKSLLNSVEAQEAILFQDMKYSLLQSPFISHKLTLTIFFWHFPEPKLTLLPPFIRCLLTDLSAGIFPQSLSFLEFENSNK